ncbi:MAG: right-handed parallel beta-helix repeat-containing protein [Thermoplasmata archaeon]|nr:MAG: right-handed parallel beta-helix repeat-containing protein [Thermoplasmata archaeon]
MKKVEQIAVILMILLSCLVGVFIISSPKVGAYTPHDPILIDGDADFAAQAAAEGWPGDGTVGNPYIIEGYEINTSFANGIEIRSTTVYFVIRNTLVFDRNWYVSQSFSNINLYNVRNATIENCTIKNNFCGIFLNSSSEINIFGNNITDNHEMGLYFENSSGNNIINNNITYLVGTGMYFYLSNGNYISGNNISSQWGGHAIHLYYSVQNSFVGNTMLRNGIYIEGDLIEHWSTNNIDISNTIEGKPVYFWRNQTVGKIPHGAGKVILINCTNITIENQEIEYASSGVSLVFSSFCNIKNNSVSKNYPYGIYLYQSSGNLITGNNASYHGNFGIYINNSNENNITSNTVLSNGDGGISLDYSNGNNIANNKVLNNREGGIYIGSSHWNNISNNEISNFDTWHDSSGITLINSSINKIIDNNLSGYYYGIHLQDCKENIIQNNNVTNGYQSISSNGIYLDHSNGNDIIDNNILNFGGNGLSLESSNWNDINGNYVSNSKYGSGIQLLYSNGNNLTNNKAFSNEQSGFFIGISNWTNIAGNVAFSNNMGGISLSGCSNNTVSNNNISNDLQDGIGLISSSNNVIRENNISKNNRYGIYLLLDCNENHINNNIVSNNNESGIFIQLSNRNNIIGNNISMNEIGILLWNSTENIFHHNNIFNNREQFDQKYDHINTWDDGGGEGNYWGDYYGFDEDGDGVGDTGLPHHGVDYHPLTNRQGTSDTEILQPILIIMIGLSIIILLILLTKKTKPTKKEPSKKLQDESWIKGKPPGIKGLR